MVFLLNPYGFRQKIKGPKALILLVVGEGGLEPPHTHIYRILRPTRLPFRHSPKVVRQLIEDDLDIIPLKLGFSQAISLKFLRISRKFLDRPQLTVTFDIAAPLTRSESPYVDGRDTSQ